MWRSVRRASRHPEDEHNKNVELHEIQCSHRRTKSWNKRHSKPVIDELMMTPLQMEPLSESTTTSTLPTTMIPTPAKSSEETTLSSERHRVVSFSTPKKAKRNEDEESVEEFCITARHHLV
uniref:Uncharacterized protein n=1 Tax=Steinernema glaseri TaxID=37863 RepID=A0A1I8AAC4_9BILA